MTTTITTTSTELNTAPKGIRQLIQMLTYQRISENNYVTRWRGMETILQTQAQYGSYQQTNATALHLDVISPLTRVKLAKLEYKERENLYIVSSGYDTIYHTAHNDLGELLVSITRSYLSREAVKRIEILYCPKHPEVVLSNRLVFPLHNSANSNHYGYCRQCKKAYVGVPASYLTSTTVLLQFAELI